MWELDCEESWAPKKWCFWTLESPLDCKEIQPVHPKGDQSWVFTGRTDVKVETPILWPPEELTPLKRPWCWERLRAGEGDDRGWDGWMASLTQWTCIWVNSGSWWWTGRTGVLQFMGSQRIGHNWVTELNWTVYHLLYSPDRSPTDHHFFKHLCNFLQGKCFHNQQEAENVFQELVKSQSTNIYVTGIKKLLSHWQKCVCWLYWFLFWLIKMCLSLIIMI